ncbi:NHLP family bacteriocin export ABC transporter peptidase/permease/ATPase [Sphaerisporangium melleum]|uniref:NHLP family bacteriocin export ABC transporter peptidase/permease/ATPase n=1 Tax=Sphaerisporangium melleum TaxID=321316 RepID=A0A917RAT7_9ACTN|nr:NHLP family bacteriocin export ABC transporter peptidase/permease/ATPase [Sphaerisporangium melleum]GII73662.1 NHLP family bacteriocin export ABC transporter peptidase/permease/ATPase [Sphaerisporangium melleum]
MRTERRPQMEDADCGPACLSMIFAHHGLRVPLHEIRERTGVGRDGLTGVGIKRAAEEYGFTVAAFRVEADDLETYPVPSMIFVDRRHYVVLEGMRKRWAYINDPAVGRIRLSREEFRRRYSGIALVPRPGEDFTPGGARFPIARSALAKVRPYLTALLAIAVMAFMLALPAAATALLTRLLLGRVLVAGDTAWSAPALLGLLGCVGFTLAGTWAQQRLLTAVQMAMAADLSGRYVWRLLRLPGDHFHRRGIGGLVTRTSFGAGLALLLSDRVTAVIAAVLTMVVHSSILFAFHPAFAAVAALLAAVNLLAMRAVARRAAPHQQRLLFDEHRRDNMAFNGVSMAESLKADGAENWFFAKWAGLSARAMSAAQDLMRVTQALMVVPAALGSLAGTAMVITGGVLVARGEVSMETVIAAQLLVGAFLVPVSSLVGIGAESQVVVAQTSMLDDTLCAAVDPRHAEPPAAPSGAGGLRGEVEFREVTFGYDLQRGPVIEGLSFRAEPGQRVAIVGRTGSGKSTVARLLTGAVRPWSGEVRLDGTARDETPRETLTTSVGYVEQNLQVFEGTVADNLTLWDPTVPGYRLHRAMADAGIAEVVHHRGGLSGGWIQERGRNLSGGERQRLEIARALALSPSVLVLDEATSALDADTEALVDANLKARGCTCVVIAHRLSTVRDSDLILVLDRGKVVQRGTHAELIAEDGHYRTLVEEAA